jgi:hypothetical protein
MGRGGGMVKVAAGGKPKPDGEDGPMKEERR